MVNYWKLVNEVIKDAEILLLVVDSRFPKLTRNKEIELKIEREGKKLIYVLNKCDLVSDKDMKLLKKDFIPSIFVSSKHKYGGTLLLKKILEFSSGEQCIVGVLGYPNVGKSSVINLLKGRKSASTSSVSGHTKGKQFISAKGKIKLIDTPGVLEFKENDMLNGVIIGSYNPEKLKEPDYYAMKIIEQFPKLFENYYSVEYKDEPYDFLEEAAEKANVLIKGGKPDIQRFSRSLLLDWQRGKVHEAFFP